jgi:RNA polymerase sigma factor (sigma-70 family)
LNTSQLSDRELFERVADGASDAPTWKAFVERFSRLCFHAIHRVIAGRPSLSAADADELFQQFFLHLLDNDRAVLKRYRGDNGCSPSTYLAHLAAFQTLELARRSERQGRGMISTEEEGTRLAVLADTDELPLEKLERARTARRVRQAVSQLSTSDQLLYRYYYVKGMSLADIARRLEKTETAVHVQHFRLKERLRKALAGEEEMLTATG